MNKDGEALRTPPHVLKLWHGMRHGWTLTGNGEALSTSQSATCHTTSTNSYSTHLRRGYEPTIIEGSTFEDNFAGIMAGGLHLAGLIDTVTVKVCVCVDA